jgi:hypothetical protein
MKNSCFGNFGCKYLTAILYKYYSPGVSLEQARRKQNGGGCEYGEEGHGQYQP